MEKATSVGRILNCDTKSEMSFSLAPTEVYIEENHELRVEPCLSRSQPVVSFHGGAGKTLTTSLIYDRDADDKVDITKVLKFFSDLSKINKDTKSIPLITFRLGNINFTGYLSRLSTQYARFSTDGQATQLKLNLNILAAEGDDNVA